MTVGRWAARAVSLSRFAKSTSRQMAELTWWSRQNDFPGVHAIFSHAWRRPPTHGHHAGGRHDDTR